ncbi:MAG: glycosyltransferase family 1 protein, partial [Chloroflexi bacterium]
YYADYFGNLVGIEPEKITVVPPGISLYDYRNLTRANNGAPVIGYLARMSPEKGLHILVEAFIQLAKSGEFPGLRLKVAGYLSKAYMPYVNTVRRRLQNAGVSDQVDILGTVDRQQKLDFFRSIDVFSLPTVYRDPKGLPVLEALAAGVPVVQPEHGAFPYLVQETGGGLLHKPEDPTDLADKLAMLLRDGQLRQKLEQQGRTAVHTYFSAERMAADTMAVYERVAYMQARG